MNCQARKPTWYERSMDFINCMSDENPNLSKDDLEKLCRKEYPFGARKYYPYKAFLKAVKDVFHPELKARKEKCPNTLDIFSGCAE